MGSDGPAGRREIEDTTAARLAEIVAAAERAAKQVIDDAEEEARSRIADAHAEAQQIVAARLAGLADLTDEINAQAEALVRQAEALQRALERAKGEMGESEAPRGAAPLGRRGPEAAPGMPAGPTLSVVAGMPEPVPAPEPDGDRRLRDVPAPVDATAPVGDEPPSAWSQGSESNGRSQDPPEEASFGSGSPAGARLLATQMAVSGASRAEIEARLRDGFEIADTRPILDAILGPES